MDIFHYFYSIFINSIFIYDRYVKLVNIKYHKFQIKYNPKPYKFNLNLVHIYLNIGKNCSNL